MIMNFVFWYLMFANSLLSAGYTYDFRTNQFLDTAGRPYVHGQQINPFSPPKTVVVRGQTQRTVAR